MENNFIVGDKCSFYVDIEQLNGEIIMIEDDNADVITPIGIIKNVPLLELLKDL